MRMTDDLYSATTNAKDTIKFRFLPVYTFTYTMNTYKLIDTVLMTKNNQSMTVLTYDSLVQQVYYSTFILLKQTGTA